MQFLDARQHRPESARVGHPQVDVDGERLDRGPPRGEWEERSLQHRHAAVALALFLDHVGPAALWRLELAHPEAAKGRQGARIHRHDIALGVEVDRIGDLLADVRPLRRGDGAQEELRSRVLRRAPGTAEEILEGIGKPAEGEVARGEGPAPTGSCCTATSWSGSW